MSQLISAIIAAIVAAAVAWATAQKRISIENITQERRNWREKVRARALDVHDALVARDADKLARLKAEFRAILNPFDAEDVAIIECISVPENGQEIQKAEEFAGRIAHLLKHDWQRAKLEAGPWFMRLKCVRHRLIKCLYEPERQKYESKEP